MKCRHSSFSFAQDAPLHVPFCSWQKVKRNKRSTPVAYIGSANVRCTIWTWLPVWSFYRAELHHCSMTCEQERDPHANGVLAFYSHGLFRFFSSRVLKNRERHCAHNLVCHSVYHDHDHVTVLIHCYIVICPELSEISWKDISLSNLSLINHFVEDYTWRILFLAFASALSGCMRSIGSCSANNDDPELFRTTSGSVLAVKNLVYYAIRSPNSALHIRRRKSRGPKPAYVGALYLCSACPGSASNNDRRL